MSDQEESDEVGDFLTIKGKFYSVNASKDDVNASIDLIPGKSDMYLFEVRDVNPSLLIMNVRGEKMKLEPDARKNYKMRKSQIVMLADDTLDKFCDAVPCDKMSTKFVGKGGSRVNIEESVDKARLLLIENALYADFDEEDEDSITKMKNLCSRRQIPIMDMKKCVCADLKEAKLNFYYVYKHLGHCEHLFSILSIMRVGHTNCLKRDKYPFIRHITAKKRRFPNCQICLKRKSHWLITNSTRILGDPSNLCSSCHQMFNFVNGEKVENFTATRIYNFNADSLTDMMRKELDDSDEEEIVMGDEN